MEGAFLLTGLLTAGTSAAFTAWRVRGPEAGRDDVDRDA